jgi:hypothetical protein
MGFVRSESTTAVDVGRHLQGRLSHLSVLRANRRSVGLIRLRRAGSTPAQSDDLGQRSNETIQLHRHGGAGVSMQQGSIIMSERKHGPAVW